MQHRERRRGRPERGDSPPSSQLARDAAHRRTTVSDIVEEAQMSRPTVYRYVGSKEEAIV
ncbi:helix-turn-helix transcriptional regulator [Streptomyces sp. R302]|nr:helix-turn-helix transcriptional regulator [Streptomyces sp. R301]NML80518.1 helix-turn-helix transcriptional regulator [Streptomyces sp. R302]